MFRFILIGFLTLGLSTFCFGQRSRSAPPPPVKRSAPAAPANTANDFYGILNGGKYSNDFFGFTVSIPESYTVINKAEIGVYSSASAELLKKGSDSNNRKLDDAMKNQAALLMVSQLPPGSAGNAILEVQVRKQTPGVSANMVLADSVKLMTGTTAAVVTRHFPAAKLGNRTFVGAEFELDVAGQKLTQQFFVTMRRGYAVLFGLTYAANADREAFTGVFAGLNFKPQ